MAEDQPGPVAPHRRARRGRRAAAVVLVVVGCLLFTAGGLAVWTSNLLLDTDRYVSSVGPLAGNPAVQEGVATALSNHLIAQVDVEQRAREVLPEKAAFLAAPLAQTVRRLVHTAALDLLQSRAFRTAWVTPNRFAHDQVAAALTGEGGRIATKDGKVTVDLSALEARLRKRMDESGITVFDKLPTRRLDASYELVDLHDLAEAQQAVRLLRTLRIVLPLAALVAFVLAIVLWPGTWRGVAWVGFGLAITGVVVQLGLLAGRHVLAGQAVTPEGARALQATVNQLAARFTAGVRLTILLGVFVGAGALAWDHRDSLRPDRAASGAAGPAAT